MWVSENEQEILFAIEARDLVEAAAFARTPPYSASRSRAKNDELMSARESSHDA